MSSKPNKTIAQRLLDAELAINNTLNSPSILAAVTPFGYDQAKLLAAKTLHQETLELVELQKKEYGEQYDATAAVEEAREAAEEAYTAALKIARLAFRGNDSARNALGLAGERKQSISGWLDETRRFYNNLLRTPAFLAKMATFNYSQAKLEAELALVDQVGILREIQHKERGEAQEATKVRDAKLDELDQWLADYKVVAEVALAASPQQLEQLGWIAS